MSITINPFRQVRQSDPTPQSNMTTSGNSVAGRERSWHSQFDGLFSRKKKTISTQPPTEKPASTDSKTSQTVRNVAKRLKKAFRPCGSSQSKLIKQFSQVPSRPAPADNRTGVGTKASAQTSTTKGNTPDTKPPERKDSLAHLAAHEAGSAPRSGSTSSKQAFARIKVGQVNVKKAEFKKIEVEVKTMKAELLSTKTVISEAKKAIKEATRKNRRGNDNAAPNIKDIAETASETELLKAFHAPSIRTDNRAAARTKSPTQTGATKGNTPRFEQPKHFDSLMQWVADEIKAYEREDKRKMEPASLLKKTLISEGLKTAKKSGRWLPVEPGNLTPPIDLSKSDKGSVME